ncbi:group 3/4 sigma-70 RNA polymerase sigma factor [Aphanothece hegewaldii CCALA 016]|uniref:Group 3/4 sigma-70 RNA polymerase sigma factor n=1 Tax=Aphanothece hegewaldii CCALA 016 TaxID=2107694 RepID=A0A2T1LST9_9CHRO|nr:sigma-70 family RNA polymerase sigma factor [Aphanothece hegewaldii]PSF33167.1 group 3/4 sigma-70 RNA polymerase sigma factor [Aphanothece hegewaldii CCALA 016]
MQPRQDIIEIFSTFIKFEADRFSGWAKDPQLRRSMQYSLKQFPQTDHLENFWAFYWYKQWQQQNGNLAKTHLSAYLQETCYWTSQKIITPLGNKHYKLSDCFQVAIARIEKILKGFKPDPRATLKTYAAVAFRNLIKDELRQRSQVELCNDWGLLHKISKKQLKESLENAGLNQETINRYCLAWNCFTTIDFPKQSSRIRQLSQSDQKTWEAIAKLYNRQRLTQLSASEPQCSPQTLEKWLFLSASLVRTYLYPPIHSLNMPKSGEEYGKLEISENLSTPLDESLLTEMIAVEESQQRQSQHNQINTILTSTLAQIEPSFQQLLQLYYQQQLTQQEIAKTLQMQQYQISRRLTKAREILLLALVRWSEETLHITVTSTVKIDITTILEEWLQNYYHNISDRSSLPKP